MRWKALTLGDLIDHPVSTQIPPCWIFLDIFKGGVGNFIEVKRLQLERDEAQKDKIQRRRFTVEYGRCKMENRKSLRSD